jgi:hypothetical protein
MAEFIYKKQITMQHLLEATTTENRNVLTNFLYNERSNVECLFIPDYDLNLIQCLDSYITSFQMHRSFKSFLGSELKEQYQFIDMQDLDIISETDSANLFQRVRGKVKVIVYDSSKSFHRDFLKHCGWMRMYTWKKV